MQDDVKNLTDQVKFSTLQLPTALHYQPEYMAIQFHRWVVW